MSDKTTITERLKGITLYYIPVLIIYNWKIIYAAFIDSSIDKEFISSSGYSTKWEYLDKTFSEGFNGWDFIVPFLLAILIFFIEKGGNLIFEWLKEVYLNFASLINKWGSNRRNRKNKYHEKRENELYTTKEALKAHNSATYKDFSKDNRHCGVWGMLPEHLNYWITEELPNGYPILLYIDKNTMTEVSTKFNPKDYDEHSLTNISKIQSKYFKENLYDDIGNLFMKLKLVKPLPFSEYMEFKVNYINSSLIQLTPTEKDYTDKHNISLIRIS